VLNFDTECYQYVVFNYSVSAIESIFYCITCLYWNLRIFIIKRSWHLYFKVACWSYCSGTDEHLAQLTLERKLTVLLRCVTLWRTSHWAAYKMMLHVCLNIARIQNWELFLALQASNLTLWHHFAWERRDKSRLSPEIRLCCGPWLHPLSATLRIKIIINTN